MTDSELLDLLLVMDRDDALDMIEDIRSVERAKCVKELREFGKVHGGYSQTGAVWASGVQDAADKLEMNNKP